ncbi:MAG TPA: hypothetical protein VFG87_26170 [Amycolatopsis sp.]|jgi:hypothetical protein|nr:hypothetical protein [Amycolatopsis sp.]
MIKYQLALLGHSQRYLLPALAFTALLGLLYSNESGNPAPPEFAVSGGALTVVACWLTITLADIEDPAQWLITLAHARRLSIVVGSVVLTVFAGCAGLTVLSLLWSALAHGGESLGDLGIGLLAQLTCACAGIAVGLPCSRLLMPRAGYTALAAIIGVGVVLLTPWIPLVNPLLRALSSDQPAILPILVSLFSSVLVLVGSAAAVVFFRPRRD